MSTPPEHLPQVEESMPALVPSDLTIAMPEPQGLELDSAIPKLEIDQQEVPEDITEETPVERDRRRTSMRHQMDLLRQYEKSKQENKHKLAVPIKTLYGSICRDDSDDILSERAKAPAKQSDYLRILRSYRLFSRNYANIFMTRCKVMEQIVRHIIIQYQLKLQEKYKVFQNLSAMIKKTYEAKQISVQTSEQITRFNKFMNDLKTEFDLRKVDFEEILLHFDEQEKNRYVMGHVEKAFHDFSNAYGRLIRKVEQGKKDNSLSEPEFNPFLAEFNLLLLFEWLRRYFYKTVIPMLLSMHKHIMDRLVAGLEIIAELLPELHKPKESDAIFTLCSLLEKPLSRFVKQKVGLKGEFVLKDCDLEDFFRESYEMKYPEISPLWRCHLPCIFERTGKNPVMILLFIDVIY